MYTYSILFTDGSVEFRQAFAPRLATNQAKTDFPDRTVMLVSMTGTDIIY